MKSLRASVVRLAHEHPEFRKPLLAALKDTKKEEPKKEEPKAKPVPKAPPKKGLLYKYPILHDALLKAIAKKLPNPMAVASFVVHLLEKIGAHDQAILADRILSKRLHVTPNVETTAVLANAKTAAFTLRFPMAFKNLLDLVAKKLTSPLSVAAFCVHLLETTGAHDSAEIIDRLLVREKDELKKTQAPEAA